MNKQLNLRCVMKCVTVIAVTGAFASLAWAANPPWYKPGTMTGFPPNGSDFYQHQKLKPTAACPGMSPPGQCDATWEPNGGWCNRATYTNACYRLYKEGSTKMFGAVDPNIQNPNWLDIINNYIAALAGGMSGEEAKWQKWLDDHDDAAAPKPLKYDYVVFFPDVWFKDFTMPAPPASGWHYLGFDGATANRKWKPVPGTPYDKVVSELKDGSTVMMVLRTLPWEPAFYYTNPPTNTLVRFRDPKFDSSLWWRGNGGVTDVTAPYPPTWINPPKVFAPSWGAFHSVMVTGINEAQRKIYFSDPDSNKGSFIANAGFDADANEARKYHPWIPDLNGGDAIPVPPRGVAANDPPLFHWDYYQAVTIDDNTVNPPEFRGRRISPGNAANERYKNVVINMLEIVATAKFRKKTPVGPPLHGAPPIPTLNHEFEAECGSVNGIDEIWFLPVKDIASVDPPLGALAGWQVTYIDPPAVDPYGNDVTTRGVRLYRGVQPPLMPGELGEIHYFTQQLWDEKEYEVFVRDADDPASYRVQSYGIIEAGFDDQALADDQEYSQSDLNGDCMVDLRDLKTLIESNPSSDAIIDMIRHWGPCK